MDTPTVFYGTCVNDNCENSGVEWTISPTLHVSNAEEFNRDIVYKPACAACLEDLALASESVRDTQVAEDVDNVFNRHPELIEAHTNAGYNSTDRAYNRRVTVARKANLRLPDEVIYSTTRDDFKLRTAVRLEAQISELQEQLREYREHELLQVEDTPETS